MNNLGKNFYSKLVSISSELGMKPEDLLAVMVSESGISPTAHEQKYNGGGLLGFMPQTLKNLDFHGSPEDFRKLSGETQLDYVKKMVQSFMEFNDGKPFKSATQYYLANFVPVSLKLPGIKAEDPSCAFLEQNPKTVRGKDGKLYSKKYNDVGVKLLASNEKLFYNSNKLFHGTTPGAITYGDMDRQVAKNKKSSIYIQAINDMKNATGYTASQIPDNVTSINYKPKRPEHRQQQPSSDSGIISKFKKLLDNLHIDIAASSISSDLESNVFKYAQEFKNKIEQC